MADVLAAPPPLTPAGERIAVAAGDLFFSVYYTLPGAVALQTTSTGNVGIGTSSPSQRLEVAGTVFSSSGGVIIISSIRSGRGGSSGGGSSPSGPYDILWPG